MINTLAFNPVITTNAAGSFNVTSDGFIQGTALDAPAVRFRLRSGQLANTEALPMWGGVGISENIPNLAAGQPNDALQSQIIRATSLAGASAPAAGQLTGFSVFDQNHSAIQTPQSPVPLVLSGMTLNYYPLGSGARIAVACDPILAPLEGDIVTSRVGWDLGAQMLVAYEASAYTVSSGTYDSATGVGTVTLSTTPGFSAGVDVVLSSLTGTGAFADLDGTWPVTGVAGDVVTFQATAGLGAATITGGSLTQDETQSVALPCRVLDFNFGNSMTVSYDATTGFATWNRSGSCAIIQI